MTNEIGIIWALDGAPYARAMTKLSIASAKHHMPDVPRVVLSSCPELDSELNDVDIIPLKTKFNKIWIKFDAMQQSPFERSVFLDADTYVLRDFSEQIKKVTLVSGLKYAGTYKSSLLPSGKISNLPKTFPIVNSGVTIWTKSFLPFYEMAWKPCEKIVETLPGGDQYVFSLVAQQLGANFEVNQRLQVTTSLGELNYRIKKEKLPNSPKLIDVPWVLLAKVDVLHYTENKFEYLEMLTHMHDTLLASEQNGSSLKMQILTGELYQIAYSAYKHHFIKNAKDEASKMRIRFQMNRLSEIIKNMKN